MCIYVCMCIHMHMLYVRARAYHTVLAGNEYVLTRRDGVLLDGRPDGASAQIYAVAQSRDRAAGAAEGRGTAFAIGNKVNHPPRGVQPNVLVYPLDLMADEQPPLHDFLPVYHFRPPAAGQPSKQTAVFIATRVLRNEELFLDYKCSPLVGNASTALRYDACARRESCDPHGHGGF